MKTSNCARLLPVLLAGFLSLSAAAVAPTAQASDSPPPPDPIEQVYKITGGGDAHGVGMSQRGARGRALAGQTYEQIIAFYYSDHTLATLDTSNRNIRVLLATDTLPTDTKPVRITARVGGWTSSLFSTYAQPFPPNSYLDVVTDGAGGWTANVIDPTPVTGPVLLDTAALSSSVLMEPAQPETQFEMKYRDYHPANDLNRGSIRIRVLGTGRLQTIGILNIETYLRGVVPAEINSSWPAQALRAQAVASRGFAMSKIKSDGHWDIQPYSIHQVYGGVKWEKAGTNSAVADTAGKVVLNSSGKVVETLFHATAGGHTESSEFAWPKEDGTPGTKYSHLKGRADVDANGVPYEAGAPNLTWALGEVSHSQLSEILSKSSKTNVGTLISFEFKRGVSGRVHQAILVGSAGTKYVSGAIFKNVFDKHSGKPALKSTLFYFGPTVAAQLVSQTPAPNATEVHRRTPVEIVFSEPVSGVSSSTLRVYDTLSGTRISGKVGYDANTLTARFTPDALLPAGKLLRVELRTGVASLAGGASIQPTDWTFRVTTDATKPTVASAKTKAGSTKVYRDSSFVVRFSEPVVGVSGTTVRLRNVSNGSWVTAKVTYDAATRTATLVPSKLLAKGKTYRLVVRTAIQDLAGNSAVKFTWKFTVR